MGKIIDERILDYINVQEEKEVRRDIYSKYVKINKRFYKFIETEFFNKRLSMYIPTTFEDMPFHIKQEKYPSRNRPQIIKTNHNKNIILTLKFMDYLIKEQNIDNLKNLTKILIKNSDSESIFLDDGILESNENKISYFDYKSYYSGEYMYNLAFFFILNDKTVMGTFECTYKEAGEWKNDIIFQMLKTVKVNN